MSTILWVVKPSNDGDGWRLEDHGGHAVVNTGKLGTAQEALGLAFQYFGDKRVKLVTILNRPASEGPGYFLILEAIKA